MVSANTSEAGNSQNFSNSKEEALYWKKIAEDSLNQLQRVRDEFDEYQRESLELEGELETQLEQNERKVADLLKSNCKLKMDSEICKEKFGTMEREANMQAVKLQHEMVEVKMEREALKKYVRELEQANDDLERGKRVVISTLEEFDVRLNNLIERNAFLESELEEKELSVVNEKELSVVDENELLGDSENELSAANEGELPTVNENDVSGDSVPGVNDGDRNMRISLFPMKDTLKVDETKGNGQSDLSGDNQVDNQQTKVSCKKMGADVEDGLNKTDGVITLTHSETLCINKNINPALEKSLALVNEQQRILALDILGELLSKVGALESKFIPTNLKLCNATAQRKDSGKASPLSERSLRIEAASPTSINEKYSNGKKIPRCISNNSLARFVKLNI